MKIITGHMERNMGVCAAVADRILHFATNVIRISTSEMHANFSSQNLKVGDRFENVGVYKIALHCGTAGFRRDAEETCALLGCYAAYSGTSVPTFLHDISIPSSGAKKSQKNVICIVNIGVCCNGS
jgi:hypothetical protein